MANGWVPDEVQQYRAHDGNPLNIHPDNLMPLPVIERKRKASRLPGTQQLRTYFG